MIVHVKKVEVMQLYMNEKRKKEIMEMITKKLEAFEAFVLPRMESLT